MSQKGDEGARPTAIDIEAFTISNFDQSESHDIRFLVPEFSVYASIFMDHYRGEIVVEDALSLPTRMPIVGEEGINISFSTPSVNPGSTQNPKVEVQGRITALKNLFYTNVRSPMYRLAWVSQSRLVDLMSVIRVSFGPELISDIVKKIGKDYLALEEDKFEVEETVEKHKFVAASWSPVETLRYLAREAMSAKHDAGNFLFWEDWNGHYFKTIESLIEADIAEGGVYFFTEQSLDSMGSSEDPAEAPAGNLPEGVEPGFNNITNVQIHQFFDIEKAIQDGTFDNKILWVDTLMQQYEAVNHPDPEMIERPWFKYFDDWQKLKQVALSPHRLISKDAMHGQGTGDSHIRFLHANPNQTWEEFQVTPRQRQKKLPFTVAQSGALNASIFHITVPGDTRRKPGDVIRIDVPEFGATDDILGELHRYMAGKWLVIAVRHRYNHASGFHTVMEVVKNSLEDEIAKAPGEQDENQPEPAELPPLPEWPFEIIRKLNEGDTSEVGD